MKNIYWNVYLVLFYIKILQNAVLCLKMTSLVVNALVKKNSLIKACNLRKIMQKF